MITTIALSAMSMGVIGEAVTQVTKRWDRKPFNCGLCMTFWLSLFIGFMTFKIILNVVMFVGIAVFTRQLLWKVWPTMF